MLALLAHPLSYLYRACFTCVLCALLANMFTVSCVFCWFGLSTEYCGSAGIDVTGVWVFYWPSAFFPCTSLQIVLSHVVFHCS